MPAFNQARFIVAAVESVLNQTLSAWELVVVDDGSTDGTFEKVAAFRDPRIRLVRQENRGVCDARNRALGQSRSEYVAFLDADDVFDPRKLEIQTAYLDARPHVGISYSSRLEIDERGTRLGFAALPPVASLRDFVLGFPFAPTDVVARRSWIDHVGGFRPGFVINEDREWFIRLALAGCECIGLPDFLSCRRLNGAKVFNDLPARLDDMFRSLDAAFCDPRCPADVQALRHRARGDVYISWAYQAAIQGERSLAREYFRQAFVCDPLKAAEGGEALVHGLMITASQDGGDHEARIHRVFDAIPPECSDLERFKLSALAHGFLVRGVRALLGGRWETGRERIVEFSRYGVPPAEAVLEDVMGQILSVRSYEEDDQIARRILNACVDALTAGGHRPAARWLTSCYAFNSSLALRRQGRHVDALAALARAISTNPSYLRNRGTWSVLVRSSLLAIGRRSTAMGDGTSHPNPL